MGFSALDIDILSMEDILDCELNVGMDEEKDITAKNPPFIFGVGYHIINMRFATFPLPLSHVPQPLEVSPSSISA